MSSIPRLSCDEFHKRLAEYCDHHPASVDSAAFEAQIDNEVYEHLAKGWQNGWDYDCQTQYFGGRGASVLIQNVMIDWTHIWEFLRVRTVSMPPGALINFEVYDRIKDGVMVAGKELLRRVVTPLGTFDKAH